MQIFNLNWFFRKKTVSAQQGTCALFIYKSLGLPAFKQIKGSHLVIRKTERKVLKGCDINVNLESF